MSIPVREAQPPPPSTKVYGLPPPKRIIEISTNEQPGPAVSRFENRDTEILPLVLGSEGAFVLKKSLALFSTLKNK